MLAVKMSADNEERSAEKVEGDGHTAFSGERHARHDAILVGHYKEDEANCASSYRASGGLEARDLSNTSVIVPDEYQMSSRLKNTPSSSEPSSQ